MSESSNEPLEDIDEQEAAEAAEVTDTDEAEEDEFTEDDALAATKEALGEDDEAE